MQTAHYLLRLGAPMIKRVVFLAVLTLVALIAAAPARADVISDWYETADAAVARATRLGPARTLGTVHARSQVALAMFEATNAIEQRFESYLGGVPSPQPGASPEAAAAAAAYTVLISLFPDQRAAFEEAYAFALARVPDGAPESNGVALGVRAGELVLARGERIESAHAAQYRPRTIPGVWAPTLRPVFDSWELTMRPWFMDRADQLRPGPPPALTSARYARDVAEVQRLGRIDSTDRRPEQTSSVMLWQSINISPALRQVAALPGRTLAQNARFYALMSMASDDAYLAVTDAKLHYGFWRPIAAIRYADQDGNDITTADPDWEPYRTTPVHPEYPCAHCITGAAHAAVAAAEPNARVPGGLFFFDPEIPGVVVTVEDFDEYSEQMSMSRIYGGVHYRFSVEAADTMGRRIGQRAVRNFMRPLH
jgi:hypothetical protein